MNRNEMKENVSNENTDKEYNYKSERKNYKKEKQYRTNDKYYNYNYGYNDFNDKYYDDGNYYNNEENKYSYNNDEEKSDLNEVQVENCDDTKVKIIIPKKIKKLDDLFSKK